MSDKMHLVMVLHCHQPVGNFDWVFAMANSQCYRPVIEILHEYPSFRLGLHFSGPLLNWLQKNDPRLLQMIKEMRKRDQVELLSGAFYEPLLAAIPEKDALAQLALQNKFLEKNFKAQARGFWLAERIWDPSLPRLVCKAGMDYTIVDDTHFYYSGLKKDDMFGYRLTEREGHTLALFPTHQRLRYTIPFKEPQETLAFLRQAYEQHGSTCATYGDDGEKFGLWPQTNDLVIKRGWLKRFIGAVLEQQSWLTTTPPGEYMATHPPRGRIYLPTSSYEEMLAWALPPDIASQMETISKEFKKEGRFEEIRRFLRGGIWENFLVKYRESNLMHKKMLQLSSKFSEPAPPKAYDHLLQAQCNCSYWHGLFGGLYLSHIRNAVHANLIAAQSILDKKRFPRDDFVMCVREDVDLDGRQEVSLASHIVDCLIHPGYGGSVSMLNLRPPRFNLANTLTRRPEAYHRVFEEIKRGEATAVLPGAKNDQDEVFSPHDRIMVKEDGLERYLLYDWYDRAVFQDHILPTYLTVDDFRKPNYTEWGDFVDQPYDLINSGLKDGKADCQMERKGHIWAPGGPWDLVAAKHFTLEANGRLVCSYRLNRSGSHAPAFFWASELNFTLLSSQDKNKYLEVNEKPVSLAEIYVAGEAVEKLSLVNLDDNFRVNFSLNRPARLWCWPVETVNQSEGGLEKNYQGSSLLLLWDVADGAIDEEFVISMDVQC